RCRGHLELALLTAGERAHGRGRLRLGLLGLGPVVEVPAIAARLQAPHVRALGIGALELLVRRVAVLIPVVLLVLLRDAEVDERPAPNVSNSHGCGDVSRLSLSRACFRRESAWPLLRRRRRSPARCPSRARAGLGPRRAHANGGSTAATPRVNRRAAASSSGRERPVPPR